MIGRLFGLVWLVFLLDLIGFFRSSNFSTAESIAAWSALAAFTLAYIALMFFGVPLWATRSHADVIINRVLVGTMIAINTIFVVVFPEESFAYVYIYAAVCAGMYLYRREAMRLILGIVILAVVAGLYAHASSEDIGTSVLLVGGIGMNTVFWSALMAQNRELRRARAEITRLAISEERLRFSRDLHDLLGHSLSLIALKSELASRLLESHPTRAASELADVERVARTALQEVRDAVTGYRTPTLHEELDNASQTLAAAGTHARIRADVDDLPIELDRVLAWFLREGTTNIIRHANASRATISISSAGDHVYAELTDNGSPLTTQGDGGAPMLRPSNGRKGYGLVGLGERIRACGGEFTSGSLPDGGFRLYTRIPLTSPTDPISASSTN